MQEYKLKIILAFLVGVVFAFLFIVLAFVLPTKKDEATIIKRPTNILEEVSESLKK